VAEPVHPAFDLQGLSIPIDRILPTKNIVTDEKKNQTLRRIIASIPEVGLIEPLIVYPQKSGKVLNYSLLDGHIRLEALRRHGYTEIPCLISTENETYTYNHKVSVMPPIQQHFMIMRAIDGGVSEQRLAAALDLNIQSIRNRRDFLNGICSEAVELLKTQRIGRDAMREIRRVKPMRQIEIAELMLKCYNFSTPYAKCLVAATPDDELAEPEKPKAPKGLTSDELAGIEREMESLEQNFLAIENTHGQNVLNLVLAIGYLKTLVDNAAITRYLANNHPGICVEFRNLVASTSLECG
jgi:hypothetical protein